MKKKKLKKIIKKLEARIESYSDALHSSRKEYLDNLELVGEQILEIESALKILREAAWIDD